MRWCAGLVLVFAAAAPAPSADPKAKPPTEQAELQRFQGTWRVESWAEGGKPLPAAEATGRTVFFGNNLFVVRSGAKIVQAGTLKLDPAKSPPTFNGVVKQGDPRDGVLLGVYSLDAGTLTLCYDPKGQDRPTTVKPDADAALTVAVLKRPPQAADETVDIVGKYRSESREPDGSAHVSEAVIERRGDAYQVTYRRDGQLTYIGTAVRSGDTLSMAWVSSGQAGVSVYRIEKGPKLVGQYTTLAGIGILSTETLTPFRRVD